jgi:hypothetical protein
VMIGDGVLDYATYLRCLAALAGTVPLMLEHLDTPGYATARNRLLAIGTGAGVPFMA